MSTLAELPTVTECTVDGCSYNHEASCHAGAVTIGGHAADASCATFIPLTVRGGLEKVVTAVGACQRADCTHNDHLECGAPSVRIGGAEADCLTFELARA